MTLLLFLRRAAWLWALLLATSARAQPAGGTLRKDLKKDFGAVGDGRTNDQAAFVRAADFFNKRAQTSGGSLPAVLTIPAGTYLVSPQAPGGEDLPVLTLAKCHNLTIAGADSSTTIISYAKGLRYGAFDPKTRLPYEAPTAFFSDPQYAARVGGCITLSQCENVEIKQLTINGNSQDAQVGGHWGDTGIQLGYDAVFVGESRRISLRQLALHHLGRDGVQVLNHLAKGTADPQLDNIVFDGVSCRYNGRQGVSLTGVNGFQATNCSFSHTGRVMIPALGKPLVSNPAAGVDLEPENAVVANVRFENCRFVDNAGQGIVADRPGGDHPETTRNVVFSNCLVWSTSNWSAWVTQPGFLFKNCRIYGAFVHGCRAATPADATRFVGCTFEDRPYHGHPAYGPFTMHSDGAARSLSFTDCRFVGTHSYLIHIIPPLLDTVNLPHFRGCSFVYDYAQPPEGSYDKILGSVFSGTTVFMDGPHRTSHHRTGFMLGNSSGPAPTVLRAPGSLQFLAPNSYYLLNNGLEVGRQPAHPQDAATVLVAADNALVLNETAGRVPELYIGPTSRVTVKKGGSLEILRNTRVTIAGQLVVEDGAYFFVDPLAKVTAVGKGRLQVGPQVIKTKHPTLYSTYY
ncbi:MAG: right-handed parallel beta-helix repeat-containing protein [Janthinobacterium lividum]